MPASGAGVLPGVNTPDLVITGASGRLGGRVARRLANLGVPQRLLVRDPSRAPDLPISTVVRADYADAAALRVALAGARTVLMVSAAETADRVADHYTFVDTAAEVGVEHLVYTSFLGAAPDAVFTLARDHWATEERIASSGMRWTYLRDNLYADFAPHFIGPDDVLRGPAGDGRVSLVAIDDIADAAAQVLTEPDRHIARAYEMTGPEALTLAEVAHEVAVATGRPVTYHDETLEEAYASRASYGAPAWQVDAWVSTYTAIAAGAAAHVSDHVEQLAGHPATPLAEVLARHAGSGA